LQKPIETPIEFSDAYEKAFIFVRLTHPCRSPREPWRALRRLFFVQSAPYDAKISR